MPRKRPVEGVIIEYFQTIDMPNAARMLAVCGDIVKRRVKEAKQEKPGGLTPDEIESLRPKIYYPKQKEQ